MLRMKKQDKKMEQQDRLVKNVLKKLKFERRLNNSKLFTENNFVLLGFCLQFIQDSSLEAEFDEWLIEEDENPFFNN